MDPALKQRLLGAAVLIALAIIFVPMFLSNSPQQPENATLNLDIPPPPEHKFETRTLPVASPSAPVATPLADDPNKVVTVDTNAPPKVDARPEDRTPQTVASTTPAPVAAPPKPAPPVATPPAPPTATPEAAPAGRFAINMGVYADQKHANALVANVKKLGYPAYAEATDYQGKPATRVRVGPFADRAAAESVRLKIKQSEPKVPSSVVDSGEQPTADAPPTALASNRAGGWAVQLGAFKSDAEANKLRERLRGAGIASFVDKTGSGDAMLWRVRAGPYVDRPGADSARANIKQKLHVDGMIVTQP
jgi:DedD protein